jgi:hypothetical protein
MTAAQLDLFAEKLAPDATLVGWSVRMPAPCPHCYGVAATIGAGRGPHSASLRCGCGRHLGWMSAETFTFITAIVRQFGRPTEPIVVRFGAAPLGASAVPPTDAP